LDEFFSEAGPAASLITSQTSFREESHGCIAVELTKQAWIFSEDNATWTVQQDHALANATGANISNLISWIVMPQARPGPAAQPGGAFGLAQVW
jgi:hypothetical protein